MLVCCIILHQNTIGACSYNMLLRSEFSSATCYQAAAMTSWSNGHIEPQSHYTEYNYSIGGSLSGQTHHKYQKNSKQKHTASQMVDYLGMSWTTKYTFATNVSFDSIAIKIYADMPFPTISTNNLSVNHAIDYSHTNVHWINILTSSTQIHPSNLFLARYLTATQSSPASHNSPHI